MSWDGNPYYWVRCCCGRTHVGRWVAAAAPRELDVVPEFVAFAMVGDLGEIWGSLWLSTTPEKWQQLRALDLVPELP